MRREEQQAALAAQRQRMAERLRAQREALQRRLAEGPAGQARRARRQQWTSRAVVALAFAAVLLVRCDECAPRPAPAVVSVDAGVACPTGPLVKTPPPLKPVTPPPPLRVKAARRPEWDIPPGGPPPWLDGLRLQVAARGPRLSACFSGVERPGALRWSALVEPVNGSATEHQFERSQSGAELTSAQQGCVAEVLTKPAFRLGAGPGTPSTPRRVSMVIEF